jgi:hypothetical protein
VKGRRRQGWEGEDRRREWKKKAEKISWGREGKVGQERAKQIDIWTEMKREIEKVKRVRIKKTVVIKLKMLNIKGGKRENHFAESSGPIPLASNPSTGASDGDFSVSLPFSSMIFRAVWQWMLPLFVRQLMVSSRFLSQYFFGVMGHLVQAGSLKWSYQESEL